LICLQWYILVSLRLAVYTLFGKNKIKFGQTFLHPQKYALPHSYAFSAGISFADSIVYIRNFQPGVHVHLGVHLPICRCTLMLQPQQINLET